MLKPIEGTKGLLGYWLEHKVLNDPRRHIFGELCCCRCLITHPLDKLMYITATEMQVFFKLVGVGVPLPVEVSGS